VLKEWVMSLGNHHSEEKIKVKKKKFLHPSATPSLPNNVGKNLIDQDLYK